MWTVLAVAFGGVVGAPARYLLDRALSDRYPSELPIGTLLVNASGSLLFGLLTGLHLSHHLSSLALALAGTGFCGAYTTFSTFAFETMALLEEGELGQASANIAFSATIGVAVAAAGLAVGLAL